MRRWMLMLLSLALLLTGCALLPAGTPAGTPYTLYFRQQDLQEVQGGDALGTETVYYTGAGDENAEELAWWLVESLLRGPADAQLKNVIPAGTSLQNVDIHGGRAVVDLSSAYSTLSGVALTMADYSIALTLSQLPEVRAVRITVRGQDLAYRGKHIFTPQDVLLSTTEDVLGTVPARIWCLNKEGNLVWEDQELDLYEGDTQVGVVARALQQSPENRDFRTALPEGFQLRSVWLEEGTCYVNLPSAALAELPRGGPIQTALYAIVRSLCSLDAVEEVQFLVDGEFSGTYGSALVATPYTA